MSLAGLNIERQKPVEAQIALYIQQKENALLAPRNNGRDKEKDFSMFVERRIEIKNDKKSIETGNMFFEVWNSVLDEPAGLKATTAHWFFHLVQGVKLLRYPPAKMLAHLEARYNAIDPDYRYIKEAGDDNADGYVVPISIIEKLNFVKLEPFTPSWGIVTEGA